MAQQQTAIDAQRAWDEKHRIAPEEARHMVDFFENQPDVYRRRVPAPFAAQLRSQTVGPDAPTQPDRFEHDAELMAQQNGIPLWKAREVISDLAVDNEDIAFHHSGGHYIQRAQHQQSAGLLDNTRGFTRASFARGPQGHYHGRPSSGHYAHHGPSHGPSHGSAHAEHYLDSQAGFGWASDQGHERTSWHAAQANTGMRAREGLHALTPFSQPGGRLIDSSPRTIPRMGRSLFE